MFQVVLLLFILLSILSSHVVTCAHLKPWIAQDVITPCSLHSCLTDPNSFVLWNTLGSGAPFSIKWILQEDEQERENRTAGVKALYSMLAATTSDSAKEL